MKNLLCDADGDFFFGFLGMRVYIPNNGKQEDIADSVLRHFQERLSEELIKSKNTGGKNEQTLLDD